jgi:hypothetical protein
MWTVIETPIFVRAAAQLWSDDEREEFIDWISITSEAGDVIPGSGGLRKIRWTRSGLGKRGGVRVIYFIRKPEGHVVLLIVYAKAKFDNLSTDYLKRLKEISDGS